MVPNLKRVLNGWTEPETARVLTVSVLAGEKVETPSDSSVDVNLQPLSPEEIKRKPQESWSWKWWSIREPDGPTFKTDDIILVGTRKFRIEKIHDWSRSGFTKYDAVEDYSD